VTFEVFGGVVKSQFVKHFVHMIVLQEKFATRVVKGEKRFDGIVEKLNKSQTGILDNMINFRNQIRFGFHLLIVSILSNLSEASLLFRLLTLGRIRLSAL
jgi:hypothetical protein